MQARIRWAVPFSLLAGVVLLAVIGTNIAKSFTARSTVKMTSAGNSFADAQCISVDLTIDRLCGAHKFYRVTACDARKLHEANATGFWQCRIAAERPDFLSVDLQQHCPSCSIRHRPTAIDV
jgi:hypothetical protein